jgi:hypothetical protein
MCITLDGMEAKDAQLRLLAQWIDEAAQARTQFQAKLSLNERVPISEQQDALDVKNFESMARKAMAWAFAYHVDVVQVNGKWRVHIESHSHWPDGSSTPPRLSDMPLPVVQVWDALKDRVESNFGKARIFHLLFDRKFGNVRECALRAIESYLLLAHEWTEWSDREEMLNIALRLARAIGAVELAERVMQDMLTCSREVIEGENEAPGVVLRFFRPLVAERQAPDGLNAIMDDAIAKYSSPFILDELIALKMSIVDSPGERVALERRRVEVWLDAAEKAEGLVRAGHLKTALQRAQNTSQVTLMERAAAALQKVREEDLGLATFTASSLISREQLDEMLAPVVDAEDWREALLRFAFSYGPAVGSVERNLQGVEDFVRESVFAGMLKNELLGSDGLPRFFPQTEDDAKEMRLAQQETFMLQTNAPLLAMALNKVAEAHGVP